MCEPNQFDRAVQLMELQLGCVGWRVGEYDKDLKQIRTYQPQWVHLYMHSTDFHSVGRAEPLDA